MSRLVEIIDAYKDQHGQPSDSSVARAIGVKPQTLSSWRTRGLKEPPARESLRKLAALAGVDYEDVVLRAALVDAGWVDEQPADKDGTEPTSNVTPLSDQPPRVIGDELQRVAKRPKKRG